MDALQAFLSADLEVKKEVFISRLGVALVIRALDGKQIQQLTKEGSFGETLDEYKFGSLAIAKACENVDFKDVKLLEKHGVTTAEDCVQKALLAGEIALLQKEIMDISGFGNFDKQVVDAKN